MFPIIDKRETGINLRRIMDMQGVSAKDVQEYLGLGCVQSVYRWLDGINVPSVDNLYALSEFFWVPIDLLVRGNRMAITYRSVRQLDDVIERRLCLYYKKVNEQYVV